MAMITCSKCSKLISGSSVFCANCGYTVKNKRHKIGTGLEIVGLTLSGTLVTLLLFCLFV